MSISRIDFKKYLERDFCVCDVGARGGAADPPWSMYRDHLKMISFEPDPDEYHRLCGSLKAGDSILPYALSKNEGSKVFNLTSSRDCSSIFRPNMSFLRQFPNSERYTIDKSIPIEAKTLDYLSEEGVLCETDFLKIDAQGAELEILEGGRRFINEKVIGLQVEVAFKEIYEDQPLYADIDSFIHNHLDFDIFDIRKYHWKYLQGINTGTLKGQLTFADALYFKNPSHLLSWCGKLSQQEARNKILAACFMGLVYGYLDYSIVVLEEARKNNLIDVETTETIKRTIDRYSRSFRYRGLGCDQIRTALELGVKVFERDHEGWAYAEPELGVRKMFGIFI